ncbi:uncharacterized protein LOC116944326 isoform X2 [Petromyzon marinus]|uniref:uncharacterized protein LOC116944326 isoform X2 n=1 Tax=Petromyzon marinus TaxID=7757 RepID=UPI003F719D84
MALRPWALCLLFSLMLWAENTDAVPCNFNFQPNSSIFNAEVTENSENNYAFFNIPVEGNITEIVLAIIPNNIFTLRDKQLQVANKTALDRETLGETVILALTCKFNDVENRATIAVNILDVNEFDPEFQGTPYKWNISEFSSVSTTFPVPATDKDRGQITYTLDESVPGVEYFEVPLLFKGEISLNKTLKYEDLYARNLTTIALIVKATDSNPSRNATGYTNRTSTATVTVSVIDQDDQPPIFQPKVCSTVADKQLCVNAKYSATVRENVMEESIVFAPAQIRAEDGDKGINAIIKYALLSENDFFEIDASNGQIRMKEVVPSKTQTPEINLQIVAYQDDFQKFTTTTATIKVVTKNESHPAFPEVEYCGHVPNNADVVFATMCNSPNTLQLQVNDADYATGHPIVEYTIVGAGMEHIEINPTGYVLVRSSNLDAGQQYMFDIEAKDIENGDISTTRLTINVQAETTTAPTTTKPPTTTTSATIPVVTTTRHVTANTGSAITNPGGNASPTTRPGGGVSPTTRPGGNVSPTTRPGGNVSPTTRPGGNVSPTTRPGGNPSPTTRPGGDLTTTTRSGGGIITTPRTDGPVSSSNRPESVSPGGGVTPTSNPADIPTGPGISKATTTLSTNPQQSTASNLSRPTGGTTAKTTPHGAISSTTARPGGTGTTVNVPAGSTPQTTQGSHKPPTTMSKPVGSYSTMPSVPGPQSTTAEGSDGSTVTGPQITAGGSDRPTVTGPQPTAGGSDRPTVTGPHPTVGGSDRPTVTGPHPTDGGSNRPTAPDPRPTAGGSDSPTLPDPRPTAGGPEKIYTAQDMAIVGGVLGALLAVALGVIGFLLFKVLSKQKKAVKIEDDAKYGGGGGDDDGGYANSRNGSGQQDDISIADMGRDDDPNMVNYYIHLPKDHMQDTDVDRSSGYNSVSGRPTTPLRDAEEDPAPQPQPRDNPAFAEDAAAVAAAAAAADDEQAIHTKSILVTVNSNEKAANDKAGYKAVWFKDEVIPDGGEAADEADGRAGGVRFDGEPADDAEGKESSGAAAPGSGGPHGLDSSAMHTGGAVAEEDEFAFL